MNATFVPQPVQMLEVARTHVAGPEDPGRAVTADERELLLRHRQGEDGAFAELVARYRAPVYGYLVRCGVEPAARDDLFQEIFLKIHHAAWSYAPERSLHPWLFTIVANAVRSHARKRRVRRLVFPIGDASERESPLPDGQQLLEAQETAHWLDRALERLPQVQREVVLLCCVENLPQAEVAHMLSLRVNTVKTHLRRARLALARALGHRQPRRQPEGMA